VRNIPSTTCATVSNSSGGARSAIRQLAKNNLALDLKRSVAEVWLLGPQVKDLAKNNLASAEVFIFQSLSGQPVTIVDACQEQPSGSRA
jgi:hypothetical protein